MKLEKSQTLNNLARAYAGECQEGARYQFIAKKAMQEGYDHMQVLLKTIAKNEMAHAKAFYDLIINNAGSMPKVDVNGDFPFQTGTLAENLKHCMEYENKEHTVLYPQFAAIAEKEGFPAVAKMFRDIMEIENCHYMMVKQIYEKLKAQKLYKAGKKIKWKCNECGYEKTDVQPWSICPVCAMEQGYCQIPIDVGK